MLRTCWQHNGEDANLLRTCYGKTGVMDIGLYAAVFTVSEVAADWRELVTSPLKVNLWKLLQCGRTFYRLDSLSVSQLTITRARPKSRIHGIHGYREFWRLP